MLDPSNIILDLYKFVRNNHRVNAFDVLGDPVRRRILELLADDEMPAGSIADQVGGEFGISQPAVSQHLRVLRENGFATVRAEGTRRLYAVEADGLLEAREWLTAFERFWAPKLDALETELARGRRARRPSRHPASPSTRKPPTSHTRNTPPKES